MPRRINGLVIFLSSVIVVLLALLGAQTVYMVWLHKQLYTAVAGAGSGLDDLNKLLNMDVTSHVSKPDDPGVLPQKPKANPQSGDSLLDKDIASLSDLEKLRGTLNDVLGGSLSDPRVKELLNDLGVEAPPAATAPELPQAGPAPKSAPWRPRIGFEETSDRYVVTMELPDVSASEIVAKIEGTTLNVSGSRKGRKLLESFIFPGPVIKGSEKIDFTNGKLVVSIAKTPEGQSAAV